MAIRTQVKTLTDRIASLRAEATDLVTLRLGPAAVNCVVETLLATEAELHRVAPSAEPLITARKYFSTTYNRDLYFADGPSNHLQLTAMVTPEAAIAAGRAYFLENYSQQQDGTWALRRSVPDGIRCGELTSKGGRWVADAQA